MTDYHSTIIVEKLIGLGFDFSDMPSPVFERWPKPWIGDVGPTESIPVIPDDPFSLQLIRILVQSNPGKNLRLLAARG